MTYAEIAGVIRSVGIPFAYHHFPENTGQQPPFICYYYPNSNDMMADNINYQSINDVIIELYTDAKDFALEARIETALKEYGLAFSRDETYIESEKLYMVAYYTGVIINVE
jgi:hypothetical protein